MRNIMVTAGYIGLWIFLAHYGTQGIDYLTSNPDHRFTLGTIYGVLITLCCIFGALIHTSRGLE